MTVIEDRQADVSAPRDDASPPRDEPPQVELPVLRAEFGRRAFMVPRVGQPGKYKWLFAAIWLVYLIGPVVEVVGANRPLWWKLLNYALIALFIGLYSLLSFKVFPRSGRIGTPMQVRMGMLPLVATLGVIAFAGTVWVNHSLIGMWVYVGTGAGLGLPMDRKIAQRTVVAAVIGVTLSAKLTHVTTAEWLSLLFPTFFAGLATLGIRQMAVLIGELREAREQVARLAANEERLRLARDLHDLTGHSLSTITLKAELAQRILERARAAAPAGPTPRLDAALKEVADIEQVSRQSLHDIREAVSGYRRPTLAVELASACAALDAAGIKLDADPQVTTASGTHDPEAEAALAWSLREAVTNAIRHSAATTVRITLAEHDGELVLTVHNNGRGLAETIETTEAFGGNGLAGLRERLDAAGGRLSVGGTDGDFRLVAAVPLARPDQPAHDS